MTELITEKEWNDFLEMQEKIRKLVEIKTVKLSMIKYGRLPDGKDADFDLIESEFESGCIFVKYLTYSCGESDADQYNLPFEFLWDETYPAKYKEEHEKKKKLLIEKREREEQEEIEVSKSLDEVVHKTNSITDKVKKAIDKLNYR